jgi:Na+-translocating ferredoxin:NAD+ oxidoreductase subunit B
MATLADRVLEALPQTQCARCGFPDCAAYALAIEEGEAGINQCPPGGAEGIGRLAAITRQPALALNPGHGVEGPRCVAFIIEEWCIGCTLCINACPTDAIVGSNKLMHTVIETYCTGCELCLPACPVDCIALESVTPNATGWSAWSVQQAALARKRYDFHVLRRRRAAVKGEPRLEKESTIRQADPAQRSLQTDPVARDAKRAVIDAALARARLKRESGNSAV